MKIETKYNVEDEAWILDNHKAVKAQIYQLETKSKEETVVSYYFFIDNECRIVDESHVFSSRKELVDSL